MLMNRNNYKANKNGYAQSTLFDFQKPEMHPLLHYPIPDLHHALIILAHFQYNMQLPN